MDVDEPFCSISDITLDQLVEKYQVCEELKSDSVFADSNLQLPVTRLFPFQQNSKKKYELLNQRMKALNNAYFSMELDIARLIRQVTRVRSNIKHTRLALKAKYSKFVTLVTIPEECEI